jgi:hypothetical protein
MIPRPFSGYVGRSATGQRGECLLVADVLHSSTLWAPGPLDIASRTSSTLKLDGFCRGGMGQNGFQVIELVRQPQAGAIQPVKVRLK